MVNDQYIKDHDSRPNYSSISDDVRSLREVIRRLDGSSKISFFPPCPRIGFLYDELGSLQNYLRKLQESECALYIPIGELVQKLVDKISNLFHEDHESSVDHPLTFSVDLQEFFQRISILKNSRFEQTKTPILKLEHALYRFLSDFENPRDETLTSKFTLDSTELNKEIDSFTTSVNEIREYSSNKAKPNPPNLNTIRINSLTTKMAKIKGMYFAKQQPRLMMPPIGVHDEFIQLRTWLVNGTKGFEVASIVGMAGIGKTTLAKHVYEDPLILEHFGQRVWLTLGYEYDDYEENMMHILVQLNPEINVNDVNFELSLRHYINLSLKSTRYLIVLDDVCDEYKIVWFKGIFLNHHHDGSRIIVTTRLKEIGMNNSDAGLYKMPFLNKEDSWRLLHGSLFGNELCPPELVKSGEKIAKNCEGLPLLIIAVAKHLSTSVMTLEYWNHMAVNGNAVVINADDELSKVLLSSYHFLNPNLKACFLYMGVFPHKYKMQTSRLINLWRVDGVLELYESKSSKLFAKDYLIKLESTSLILVCKTDSRSGIKTCKLHTVYWHICVREAWNEKFFHVLNKYADSFTENIQNQRRLCIHNNVLFAIKDVYNSIATISATARSLLCTGPPHQYPVPMCFRLELLRVLDALTIPFYSFPVEVLKLLRLTYLSFSYNGNLPGSISKLWNLQYLIVHRHSSIISSGARSYMPMEIWNMSELKHLQVMGSDLPDPCGRFLSNLLTLLDVSSHSCSKEVLEGIPKLKKLGIRIELSLDIVEHACCFDHLFHVHKLESLRCIVVNPNNRSPIVSPPPLTSCLPRWLKKLSLSGFGYPWEYMNMFAKLENLEVLKLRDYAFRGSKWEVNERDFPKLNFVLIEDTDLEYWGGDVCIPRIRHLTIRNCYKLKELPLGLENVDYLETIELVDCNPLAVEFVKQIQEVRKSYGNEFAQVSVHFSADDEKSKA